MEILVRALQQQDWPQVVTFLRAQLAGVGAVLLYGSRSRGQEHKYSDYDLLVLASQADDSWRREYQGLDLDIEVCDASLYSENLEGRIYLLPGRLLYQADSAFSEWLKRLEECKLQGPRAWSESQRLRQAAWLQRMLRRSQGQDTVAALRRAQLAAALAETGVQILGHWPSGIRTDLETLQQHWPSLKSQLDQWAQSPQLRFLEEAVALCRDRLLEPA